MTGPAGSSTSPVPEARRLADALGPVLDRAIRLTQVPDLCAQRLQQALVSRTQAVTVGGRPHGGIVLDPRAVEVVVAARAVGACERLTIDIATAGRVVEALGPIMLTLGSASRLKWILGGSRTRDALREAVHQGQVWEDWACARGGLARLRWAIEAVDSAARRDPGLLVDPPRLPHDLNDVLARSLGSTALDGLAWVSLAAVHRRRHVLSWGAEFDRVQRQREQDVRRRFAAVRAAMVTRALEGIPIGRIREAVRGASVRLGPLEKAGLTSVQDVIACGGRLAHVPGVGDHSASQVYAAAQQLARAVEDDLAFRFDLDVENEDVSRLIQALTDWAAVAVPLRRLRVPLDQAGQALGSMRDLHHPPDSWLAVFASDATVQTQLLDEIRLWGQWEGTNASAIDALSRSLSEQSSADGAWRAFRQRAADYYAWLGEIVGLTLSDEVQSGALPQEIASAVRAFTPDLRLVTASLRGYQEFGARYALVQRRVILGDDMGLGKTVQAIAAMAHLTAEGGQHHLVVAPASVLANWLREIPRHSRLRAHRLHGQDRRAGLMAWRRSGGVGVTTYGQLDTLGLTPADRLDLLVADEAHYLKNHDTRRGMAMHQVIPQAERILFMTGTPLENRLSEFEALIGYLRPDLVGQLSATAALAGARSFREQVAPVYVRRNQADVLLELPPRIDVAEWVELGDPERRAHDQAVREGNFMALRRSAFVVRGAAGSKVGRLAELVDEATQNGRRVVVFSYFRDVLEVVSAALGSIAPVFGPITGSVKPDDRQRIIDDFSHSQSPGALISQIDAGGVGTNIQAASVVILCEPQVKPSAEHQAIARVHRMGQVDPVHVHRLLGEDSVDQRMLEILAEKQHAFDAYVRDSALADAAPEAIDISERELAARVITEEQRLMAQRSASSRREGG